MNHLLTPATSVSSMDGAVDGAALQAKHRKQPESSIFMKPSPKPKKPAVVPAPPLPVEQRSTPEDRSGAAETIGVAQAGQHQPARNNAPADAVVREPSVPEVARAPESKKRPAESDPSTEEPPAKKGRSRKYTERPIWARLARSNPLYNEQLNGANGVAQAKTQQILRQRPAPRINGSSGAMPAPVVQHQQSPAQPNGNLPQVISDEAPPWQQNPPLDNDLIRARQIFGRWERSIKWEQPHVDLERVIMDWLYVQLNGLHEVDNPDECLIEIEAKIGRIMAKDTGGRMRLPVQSATVLDEAWAKIQTTFESQMEEVSLCFPETSARLTAFERHRLTLT